VHDYRLYRGDELLGTITHTDDDFPWHNGTFDPTPEFEELRPLFEQELALLNSGKMDEWEMAWGAITAHGLRLVSRSPGADIDDFLLHIDGEQAWWRY
jgi:hypothetical protein